MSITNDILSTDELNEIQRIYQTQVNHGMSSVVLNKNLFSKLLTFAAKRVENK